MVRMYKPLALVGVAFFLSLAPASAQPTKMDVMGLDLNPLGLDLDPMHVFTPAPAPAPAPMSKRHHGHFYHHKHHAANK